MTDYDSGCFSRFSRPRSRQRPSLPGLLGGLALLLLLVSASALAEKTVTTTYYYTDVLGSVVATADAQGTILSRRTYQPYGAIHAPDPTDTEALGYTGKPLDASGLQYFGARYFDPRLGRFMGIDPVGFDPAQPFSFNRYAYANNNPYRYVDPDGRDAIESIKQWWAGGMAAARSEGPLEVATRVLEGLPMGGAAAGTVGMAGKLLGRGSRVASTTTVNLSKVVDDVPKLPAIKLKGLSQNRPLQELTHQDLVKAFEGSGFTLSNHAIGRLKNSRTKNMGFNTPNDIAKIFNKGEKFDAGRGEIGFGYNGLEAIVDPKTNVVITFRPAGNRN